MKRFDEIVYLGEPWSIIVECNDESGNDITPTAATFILGNESAPIITATETSGISLSPGRAEILISTGQQAAVGEGLFYGKLLISAGAGTPSYQAAGTLLVERVRP